MKLLHLDSSILGDASVSRQLTHGVVEVYRAVDPRLDVVYRDLGTEPLPHLSAANLGKDGDPLIDELKSADVLVIGAPMYNFTIATGLKSWIDRVTVAGKTFKYTDAGPVGLVPDKKTWIVATSGGAYAGTPIATMHVGYLKTVLNFVGIRDIEVICAEGLALPDRRDRSIAEARGRVQSIAIAGA
jgi:FMN-dependent NADH-azoreductase